jgi:hypothetical protein
MRRNGRFGRMKGFKAHYRLCDFLDETVILFNKVIQIVDLKNVNKTDHRSIAKSQNPTPG